MAELKRNFLKGKMNKDLDERLVPDGEYRDALNVEISTSEGSNQGVVQTLRGNVELSPLETSTDTTISADAVTVGHIVDESNGIIYNFVHKASSLSSGTGVISDAIVALKPKDNYSTAAETRLEFTTVFTDVYEARYTPSSFSTPVITDLPTETEFVTTGSGLQEVTRGVYPGMRVQFIGSDGQDYWAGNDVRVKSQSSNGDVLLTKIPSAYNPTNGTLVFTKERLLNFRPGTSEVESNVGDGTGSSNTPNGNIITGINLINDFLLFTDGKNEPKKINIKRSKAGTKSLDQHTILYIELNNELVKSSETTPGLARTEQLVELSHITVIRPNPNSALTVVSTVEDSTTGPDSVAVTGSQDAQSQYSLFKMADSSNNVWEEGTPFYIQTQTASSFSVNTQIRFVGNTSASLAVAIVDEVYSNNKYRMIFQSIDSGYDGTEAVELWTVSNTKKATFYNETFVYFAYRYVYTDGELSCISPYSQPAFIPGTYSYSPETGFNLGMENIADQIILKDFIPVDIPKDVVEVELLLRTTDGENIYLFRSIKRGTDEFNAISSGNSRGVLNITQEQAGSTLPSSQALRSFDAIPKAALAQEFSAGRIIYGNYTQDYNLLDNSGKFINANIDISSRSVAATFLADIESSNNYQAARQTQGFVDGVEQVSATGGQAFVSDVFPDDYWLQQPRQIATTSSSTYSDDTNFKYATKRGIYTGADSLTQTGDNYSVDGSGTTASPYLYYYTAPTTGTYVWNMDVSAIYQGTSFSSDVDGPEDGEFLWRLAIYECDTNGEMLNIDGTTYATAPTPVWYSQPTNGLGGIVNQSTFFDSLNVTAEVTLTATKNYQVFIVVNRKPAGLNSNGSIYDFQTDGITDEITLNPSDNQTQGIKLKLYKAIIGISASPSTTNTIASLTGKTSVKSDRPYQIGVVYRDKYGRESSVLVDEKNNFSTPKSLSSSKNVLSAVVNNNAPYWADSYKFFIKETTEKYHNLVMHTALANNDDTFAWLVFNSADRNKVEVGDYLVQKKKHNSNDPVTSLDAKWKIVDIANEGTETDGTVSIGGTTFTDSVISSAAELVGKFFVKVDYDQNFIDYIGSIDTISTQGITNANGAVFETDTSQTLDLDLYYEVGSSYPVKLTKESAETYIPVGSKASFSQVWFSANYGATFSDYGVIESGLVDNANELITSNTVLSVKGAISFPDVITDINDVDALATVQLSSPISLNTSVYEQLQDLFAVSDLQATEMQVGYVMSFERPDGSVVTAQQYGPISNGIIKLKPYTHPTAIDPAVKSKIQLPWYNCVSFGNGVESDTIRDDFNASELYKYVASGKQSGFKATLPAQNYREVLEENQLIYSQVYNEDAGVNKINQFLIAENIVKKINPESGSIQKLYSRDTNLIILCESKVYGGPINKDIIFNADGNGQLVSSNKVIGTITPYAGDYGISTNPESFAVDEFRIYFTDRKEGAVLRLSRDGITPIHEYGMEDWFNDNLKSSQALIGSFDSKKEEYNLTVHNVTNPGWKKEVYTVSFDEGSNGWVSFKSFIQEQGLSLNNQFFTFKNGDLYLHHYEKASRNNFYGVDNNSSITSIFNTQAGSVKSFSALSYEGSQAQIITDTGDGEYYNEFNNAQVGSTNLTKRGWYVEHINTDQQEGKVDVFVEKEGKWFNYIKGTSTSYTNANDGVQTSNNLDTKEFSVQGIGQLSANATIVSGTLSDTFALTFNNSTYANYAGEWTTEGINLYGITALSGSTDNTFTIVPAPGFVIDANNFTNTGTSSLYSAITFTNTGTANTPSNNVTATITWVNQSITADDTIDVTIQNSIVSENGLEWNSSLYFLATDIWTDNAQEYAVSFIGGVATPTFQGSIALNGYIDQYSLEATIPANEEVELIKFKISANPGYIFTPTTIPYVGYVTNPNGYQAFQTTSNVNVHTNTLGHIDYVDVTILAFANEDIQLDDNFSVSVNLGSTEAFSATWNAPEITIDDASLSTIVNFQTNDFGAPTFTIETGETWVTSVTVNEPISGFPYSSATVVTTANTGSAREADLKIFSSSDASQSNGNTLVFKQNALDAIQIYRANNGTGILIDDNDYDVNASAQTFKLMVATNGIEPVSADFTFNYTVGATGWLSFSGVELSDFQDAQQSNTTNYWVYFDKTYNDVGTTRTAIITATHPDDVATDTITIDQLGSYDSSTDTITFCDNTGASIDSFNVTNTAGITTGYLIQSPASDFNPIVVVDDVFFQAFDDNGDPIQATPVVSDITAVSGQAYTHTYTIEFTTDNPAYANFEANIKGYYQGNSYPASNNTQVADDSVKAIQPSLPFAFWSAYDVQPPAPGQTPIAPSSSVPFSSDIFGLGYIYNFAANNVMLFNGVTYNSGNLLEVGIFASSSGITYKYLEASNGAPPTGSWSSATTFSAASNPSWFNGVAITDSTGYNADSAIDGKLEFYPSTNTSGAIRDVYIGIFTSVSSSSPASTLIIRQNA